MKAEKIRHLINKYWEGKTTLQEEQNLRKCFGREDIPDDLKQYAEPLRHADNMRQVDTLGSFDVFAKINFEEETAGPSKPAPNRFQWPLRIAAGVLLLLTGFGAGYYWNIDEAPTNQQAGRQNQQVQKMRAALVDQQNDYRISAGKRLSAVNLSQRASRKNEKLDKRITDILSYTMNNDNSVNVRMAATEALFKFRHEASIKQALINGLSEQTDPLMQITLIDMLVKMKAKGSIPEMQKLLVESSTRKIVRKRLQVGIAQLQT